MALAEGLERNSNSRAEPPEVFPAGRSPQIGFKVSIGMLYGMVQNEEACRM